MIIKQYWKLAGIFLLALVLRLYKLGEIPVGFHADEIMNGYVGRFILLNGKDLYGNAWPLIYFDRFGDYPQVLPMYLSGLFTFIFGVNEFAVRFPIALAGSLLVLPVYFLSLYFFKDKKSALCGSFLAAILPWHIVLSRATAEGITGLTVFATAIFFTFKAINNNSKKDYFFAAFLFFSSYFLYASFRVLTPLVLLPLPFLFKKQRLPLLEMFIASSLITFAISQTYWGQGRFKQTSLFVSKTTANQIKSKNEALSFGEGQGNVLVARIFHNKIVGYSREFILQYLSYFSPNFLFLNGGLPDRYKVPDQGLFYLSFIPFLLLGFINIAKKTDKRLMVLLIYLLIISPLPASFTVDDAPNIHRAIFMIAPLVIIAGSGLSMGLNIRWGKYLIAIVLIAESIYFFHQYFNHSASYESFLRNNGNKELALYLKDNYDKYDKIFMTNQDTLPLYYLFFTNNFSKEFIGKFRKDLLIDKIDNISFYEDWCPSERIDLLTLKPNTLIVDRNCAYGPKLKVVERIKRQDSTEAYRLLEL